MNELSKFTQPTTALTTLEVDPRVDLGVYLLMAFFGYYLFRASLLFGALYIERMGIQAYRLFTKLCEYGCLCASGSFIFTAITTNQGGIYYGLDMVLGGLLIHAFVKGDRLLRSEYLRAHQTSKQKTVNRLIVNLGSSVFGQDN